MLKRLSTKFQMANSIAPASALAALAFVLAFGLTFVPAHGQGRADSANLLLCGGPQVLRLTVRFAGDTAKIVSRADWEADKSRGMPAAMVPAFKTTDDCKPIDNGARILITSSAGGLAIVERDSGDTLFHATVPNAHSAEVLPRNRVVAAASVNAKGDRLMLFDRDKSGAELFSTPLHSAHGVHWVETEQTLWALGHDELQAYDLVDWDSAKPSLKLRKSWKLPSASGHDLSPVPGEAAFIVTTNTNVYTFDRKSSTFTPHPALGALPVIKSVSIHPTTKRMVYTQADRPEWWTRTLRFLDPAATLAFPGDRLYKVRWASD
jgi:hypothetical protein